MKIGGGGLQSLITQELQPVKKVENNQDKKGEQNIFDPGIQKPKAKEDEIIKAVEQMNDTVEMLNRDLKFQMHKETDRIMVKVLDQKTKEVVKEFPPEEFLDMVASFRKTIGNLVDKYV